MRFKREDVVEVFDVECRGVSDLLRILVDLRLRDRNKYRLVDRSGEGLEMSGREWNAILDLAERGLVGSPRFVVADRELGG